jgi:hypothetical protein
MMYGESISWRSSTGAGKFTLILGNNLAPTFGYGVETRGVGMAATVEFL